MKTVATFTKVEDAHVLRAQLEGSGIEAFVTDEHIVQQDWLLSNAVGGVKVNVADDDFLEARELYQTVFGEDIATARKENRRKHSFLRYIKWWVVASVAMAVFSVWRNGWPPLEQSWFVILPSVFVGFLFAVIGAILDI